MIKPEEVKEHYNSKIKKARNYEQERWFGDKIRRAGYQMTLATVKARVLPLTFSSCLELGPGQGTWTKELLAANPGAKFDLVDISGEMLRLVKERLGELANVSYYESGFLEFTSAYQYDFFFSSRALEYIEPKAEAIKKINSLLRPGGRGVIITKAPKYWRNKILGRRIKAFHQGQISPVKLKKMLKNNGFVEIKVYPATMSWPFWQSARMNLRLYRLFGNLPLNFFSQSFAESYCVCFKKI